MSAPQRSTRQRSPSNLASNSHPVREKGCATSVANMGETHFGHAVLSSALALADNSAIEIRLAISFEGAFTFGPARDYRWSFFSRFGEHASDRDERQADIALRHGSALDDEGSSIGRTTRAILVLQVPPQLAGQNDRHA